MVRNRLVSFPSRKILACLEFDNRKYIYCGTILLDGRIYAGGSLGHCATFKASNTIRNDLKRFADNIYGESIATLAVSTRGSSANDVGVERVPRFGKRGRQEYENDNAITLTTDMKMALKKMEVEMIAQKKSMDSAVEIFKADREKQKTEILNMKLKLGEQCENMEKIHKDEMKKMKLEIDSQKEGMNKSKLELDFTKEEVLKNKMRLEDQEQEMLQTKLKLAEERAEQKTEMEKMKLERQYENAEMIKVK